METPAETIMVALYTDGMGTHQARCMGCAWRGPWRRKEQRATDDAKGHTAHEIASR
jgi:hypothetical protein